LPCSNGWPTIVVHERDQKKYDTFFLGIEKKVMTKQSHDHNFKNVFLDFPREALELFYPQALEQYGELQEITFVRQEPRKHRLSDSALALDMPILFRFGRGSLLLWLVEFQEDKEKFSIYKLLRYATDLMEAHPDAVVIPTVLFTDRKAWRKDVPRQLESSFVGTTFLHFEYIHLKLFALQAKDYYNINNPVAKILMPKMHYPPSERLEVLRHAYLGLYQLASRAHFEKYVDFIDVYAEVRPEEQKALYEDIIEHKETTMLAQYIKDLGRVEGEITGSTKILQRQITKRFGKNITDLDVQERLRKATPEQLDLWAERILDAKNVDEVFKGN
jgi:ribosomal protein S18